jgi:hypothetical protein
MLGDALHLLRYGVRLDDVVTRLGLTVEALTKTVKEAARRPDPVLTDMDLQTLRRLVRADRARSREEAHAEQSDRVREWRWTS